MVHNGENDSISSGMTHQTYAMVVQDFYNHDFPGEKWTKRHDHVKKSVSIGWIIENAQNSNNDNGNVNDLYFNSDTLI